MQWGALECVETCSDKTLAFSGICPARSAHISVALLKLQSSICLRSFPVSFLWHYKVNALEMGFLRPTFALLEPQGIVL